MVWVCHTIEVIFIHNNLWIAKPIWGLYGDKYLNWPFKIESVSFVRDFMLVEKSTENIQLWN